MRKGPKYTLVGLGLVALLMLATSINNLSQLSATFEPFLATSQTPEADYSDRPDECIIEDWQCDSWPVNCGFNGTIQRSCNTVRSCSGGFVPRMEKKCQHLGNPQRYSVWSACSAPATSDHDSLVRIDGRVIDAENNLIASSYVWITDVNNSRVYLETVTDTNGYYVMLIEPHADDMLLHTAPVSEGYGGNVGSISQSPQCAGSINTTADEETWISRGDGRYGMLSSHITFEETVVPLSITGSRVMTDIVVDLLIDPK